MSTTECEDVQGGYHGRVVSCTCFFNRSLFRKNILEIRLSNTTDGYQELRAEPDSVGIPNETTFFFSETKRGKPPPEYAGDSASKRCIYAGGLAST